MKTYMIRRCLHMLMAVLLLFTMNRAAILAEEVHDHAPDLSVRASASPSHVYVGDGAVAITVDITGGTAPYTVTIQAVQGGAAVHSECISPAGTAASAHFVPECFGDYELVAVVCDAQNVQVLDSVSLTVAEYDRVTESEWNAAVAGASVSSDWATSLLSVARTQMGYRESERDYIIQSGRKQGYTRYGDWFGMPYGDWNNAFLAFVAEYANISADAFLSGASCRSWVNGMRAKGAYMAPGSYTPQRGMWRFCPAAVRQSLSASAATWYR